jgi:ribosomal protein S18 acetylase RimI-like enzyme
MDEPTSFFGNLWHHWGVESIAVLLFIILWELVVKKGYEWVRDKITALKHKISGEYIAYFEDKTGNDKVTAFSDLSLRQRGLRIFGKNTQDILLDDQDRRIWELEGKLFHGHLIAGSYKEVSHRDSRSVGSFFVSQESKSMDFKGYWTGWDEENHQLSTGEYRFLKKLNVVLEPFQESDRASVTAISEVAFGHKYFESSIEAVRKKYKSAKIIVARSKDKGAKTIVGFSFYFLLPKNSLKELLHIDDPVDNPIDIHAVEVQIPDDVSSCDQTGTIGVIQSICVKSEARYRGLGRDLFAETERQLMKSNPNVILSPAWNVGGNMSAAKLLQSFNYTRALDVKAYWRKGCDVNLFRCPSRSTGCRCDMTLFKKNV